MSDYSIIIQARLYSTRLPNKVMQMVGGKTILKRIWDESKKAESILSTYGKTCKVIVAWPERYPDLDERNVLERFKRLAVEFPAIYTVRLTSDCPLLTCDDILDAIWIQREMNTKYYSNHIDGKDVQVFKTWLLFENGSGWTHPEHVIADFKTKKTKKGPCSVDTHADLERVRKLCKTK